MKLEKEVEINEIYFLKHKNDNILHRHFPWEDNILKKTTSPYVFRNPNMNEYLLKLEKMNSLMLQSVTLVRNFFNFTVNKYYNDHWG